MAAGTVHGDSGDASPIWPGTLAGTLVRWPGNAGDGRTANEVRASGRTLSRSDPEQNLLFDDLEPPSEDQERGSPG